MQAPLYVRFKGRVLGPFDAEAIKKQIARGQLSRLHEVSEDAVAWVGAARYPGLFDQPSEVVATAVETLLEEDIGAKATPTAPGPASGTLAAAPWFYAMGDGPQEGPVSFEELKSLARSGRLDERSQVWTSGFVEWVSAGSVAGLPLPQRSSAGGPAIGMSSLSLSGNRRSDDDDEVSLETCRTLAATRPWLLFCAVVGLVSASLALVMAVIGFASGGRAGIGSSAFVTSGLGMLVWAVVTGVGAGFLMTYCGRIGTLLMYKRQRNLEEVLLASKIFWQYVGIVLIVSLTGLILIMIWLVAIAGKVSSGAAASELTRFSWLCLLG